MIARQFIRMLGDESGATLVEYAITLALLSLFSIIGFITVSQAMLHTFVAATASTSAAAMYLSAPQP